MSIAYYRVDLRPAVALNPAAYPALLGWLASLRDPQVDAALARRPGTAAAHPVTAPGMAQQAPHPPAPIVADVRTAPASGRAAPGARSDPTAARHPLRPITATVLITLFFGLFGLIPATMHTNEASRGGRPTTKYWKAFGVSIAVEVAVAIATTVILVASLNHGIDSAFQDASGDSPSIGALFGDSSLEASGEEEDSAEQSQAASEQEGSADESELASAAAPPSFTQVQSGTVDFSDEDGYSASLDVTVYAPIPLSSVPAESVDCGPSSDSSCSDHEFDITSVCDDDPATTGAVRVDITATNTTSGFPLDMSFDFDASDADTQFEIAAGYSDDDSCDANGVQYNDPIQPGGSVDKTIWIIVDDWITPNSPDGNPDYPDSSGSISFSWDNDADRSLTVDGTDSVPLRG